MSGVHEAHGLVTTGQVGDGDHRAREVGRLPARGQPDHIRTRRSQQLRFPVGAFGSADDHGFAALQLVEERQPRQRRDPRVPLDAWYWNFVPFRLPNVHATGCRAQSGA